MEGGSPAYLLAQHTIEPTTSAEKTRNWRTLCSAIITPHLVLLLYGEKKCLSSFLVLSLNTLEKKGGQEKK